MLRVGGVRVEVATRRLSEYEKRRIREDPDNLSYVLFTEITQTLQGVDLYTTRTRGAQPPPVLRFIRRMYNGDIEMP